MKIATKTDKGLLRSVNQDSFAAGEIKGKAWAVVCDGMGGAKGGGVASTTAVKRISAVLQQTLVSDITPAYLRSALRSALETANADVYDMAQKNEAYTGMGTTAVTLVIAENTAYFANVGDSRIYRYSGGSLTQLTVDHSIVQSMVENGQLTAGEAKTHPRKNVITRAIGVDEHIAVDLGECPVLSGDIFLLCTDGLTNYSETEDILKLLNGIGFEDIPQNLIDLANGGGGGDNITAVVIKAE